MTIPTLAGIHHLKLPVRDLQRSADWYAEVLGYRVTVEFVEQGELAGLGMEHTEGGPPLALRLDPALAEAAAGFDYFAFGAPNREALEALEWDQGDVLVVGSSSASFTARLFLGSTATKIVRRSPVPVIVVP